MQVDVENVSFNIEDKNIISDVFLQAKQGEFVGLIGPNGSGKSTFLKNIYRVHQPDIGKVFLNHEDIYQLTAKQTSKNMAVVSQESGGFFDFSIQEMVLMGRAPHKRLLEADTSKDFAIAEEALKKVGLEKYGDRSIATLSGGEKQRVMVARALTQQAKVLILDEPTNHLDVHHQLHLMDLVKSLNITVITALHDLNIAAAYCDKIYVLENGQIAKYGRPEEVLTEQTLQKIFRVNTSIIQHPETKKTHITFLSSTLNQSKGDI